MLGAFSSGHFMATCIVFLRILAFPSYTTVKSPCPSWRQVSLLDMFPISIHSMAGSGSGGKGNMAIEEKSRSLRQSSITVRKRWDVSKTYKWIIADISHPARVTNLLLPLIAFLCDNSIELSRLDAYLSHPHICTLTSNLTKDGNISALHIHLLPPPLPHDPLPVHCQGKCLRICPLDNWVLPFGCQKQKTVPK